MISAIFNTRMLRIPAFSGGVKISLCRVRGGASLGSNGRFFHEVRITETPGDAVIQLGRMKYPIMGGQYVLDLVHPRGIIQMLENSKVPARVITRMEEIIEKATQTWEVGNSNTKHKSMVFQQPTKHSLRVVARPCKRSMIYPWRRTILNVNSTILRVIRKTRINIARQNPNETL